MAFLLWHTDALGDPIMRCVWRLVLLPMCVLLVAGPHVVASEKDERISFNREIRPILSDRCFQCHGPSDEARQAELRLDSAAGPEGPFHSRDGYHVIQPGSPQASALWLRLTSDDPTERMPPAESQKKPLTDEELALIERWILEGAEYEKFWAFEPFQPETAPTVIDSSWPSHRIDHFVLARLERQDATPQSPADKRTLIRRITFDLTGLPPTRDEIHRFVNNRSPHAYLQLIDRLMATPQYGEHMAKYWLDLVRFADTNGIHHDHYREMTPYRDWVIRSFNDNLPFDDFIVYQIAGDLYEQPTLDQQIASGFNRLHLVIDRGTALPEESYTRNVVDRVSAVGTAFLGLTLGCAVCHDHKYDPVTQKDFYQLFAFFNNLDTEPETPGKASHPPFILLPSETQTERLKAIETRHTVTRAEIGKLKELLATHSDVPGSQALESELKQKEEELATILKEKADLEASIPITLVSKERAEIRPAYILKRGAYDRPGQEVARNTPAFLPPMSTAEDLKTRMDLARWLTKPQNPLTARVTVNRIWQQFFGIGLVKTSEDFGAQGEYPSHPKLLDDLAYQFVESGWDVKTLVRSIVLSQTYQQSSKAPAAAFQKDPTNRLLGRGSRFRLDSEMIRDQVVAISGLLNGTMYGKSVKPPQPPNLWKSVSMVSSSTYSFEADTGDKINRRSIYSFWKRAMPPPQMTIFDAPTRESCTARRERTNTPVQALVLMNEGQYFHAARAFARQLVARRSLNDEQRLQIAYESITSHLPDTVEMASLGRGLEELREIYREDTESARAMTADTEQSSDQQRIEIAAYTMVVNSLFNLDVVKTRE